MARWKQLRTKWPLKWVLTPSKLAHATKWLAEGKWFPTKLLKKWSLWVIIFFSQRYVFNLKVCNNILALHTCSYLRFILKLTKSMTISSLTCSKFTLAPPSRVLSSYYAVLSRLLVIKTNVYLMLTAVRKMA